MPYLISRKYVDFATSCQFLLGRLKHFENSQVAIEKQLEVPQTFRMVNEDGAELEDAGMF